MRRVSDWFILLFFKFLCWFRYKIEVKGLDKLNPKVLNKPGGILFLPNHSTIVVDPAIVVTTILRKFSVCPIIVEYMYYMPGIHFVMKLLDAIPVPDFDITSNSLKKKKMDKVHNEMVQQLRDGKKFVIYPAGRTKYQNQEIIGGASAVHRLIQECPSANVVLVRTKGLYGSLFSRAYPTHQPTVFGTLWECFTILLKNLIFFAPRRHVIVEFEPAPADFPWKGSRQEMNRWLEHWYNKPDGMTKQEGEHPGDSLVRVPYYFWSNKLPDYQERGLQEAEVYDLKDIPEKIRDKVIAKIAEMAEISPEKIRPDMTLAADLGLDSLDTSELIGFLKDEFDVSGVPVIQLTSVGKLMAIASGQIVCKEEVEQEAHISSKWFKTIPHKKVFLEKGETFPEVFLNIAKRLKHQAAVADDRSGVLTYHQEMLRILVLANYLKTLPGEYIGIMLPESVAVNALILATQMVGKVPVMINWTVGPRHLETVVQLTDVKTIFTSWAFTDRLENIDLTPIEDRIVMLEDIRRYFGLVAKLKALFLSMKSAKGILNSLSKKTVTKDDRAVVLFTSGTESMPKGVPLTHKNVLSNMSCYYKAVDLFQDDIFFGILPPFHSFGFTASGFLGMFCGMRTAYYPNPTEGKRLAEGVEKWGITLIAGAPTFIKGMFKASEPGQMKTMRLCVTGAEKAPPDLYKLVEEMAPGCHIMEGYGITECSPVLTLNRIEEPKIGVGRPLENVELKVIHPETHDPIPLGERGLILAHGPNIFSGYLNPGIEPPFIDMDGKHWYKTGDLGFLDEKGNLTLSGRMKRFIKVGPEMISLASIEDALLQIAQKKGWGLAPEGPSLAICAKEQEGGRPKISLFSKFPISVDEVNKNLKEAGFSNLVRVSSVQQLEDIPIMGTGKINYRALESQYMA